jgi:hypothetical protein
MKNVLLLITIFYSIDAKLTRPTICRDCQGKIHTREQLELTKQPLIIDKNETCLNEQYKFIVIVKSGNVQRRNFTRQTWAKEIIEYFNIPVLYAIGYPSNSSLEKQILFEDDIHHDLLQFPILENYYNLTLKTISVLNWYTHYCSNNSNYLLYVDDDVLIHVDKLIMYMNENSNTNAIEGWFETLGKIQRTGIGGISKEDFPIDIVPDYLWGAAVLYPSNIISNVLIKTIFNTNLPIFFRDDVFINGFIAQEAEIKRQYMKGIVLYDSSENNLKNNMIVIDFKNEEHRIQAWNCYRYYIQCNKNTELLISKILVGICLILIIVYGCWRYLKSTKVYHELKYALIYWYYGMKNLYKKNIHLNLMMHREQRSTVGTKLMIRRLIYMRRIGTRIGFLCIIILVFYYLVKNSMY